MEIKKEKIRELAGQVGMPKLLLLVLAGVVLLVLSIPDGKETESSESREAVAVHGEDLALEAMDAYAKRKEKATEEILSQVSGIGKVKVMLTLATSEEKVPLQDDDTTEEYTKETYRGVGNWDISRYDTKKERILVQREGEDSPYVVQVNSPRVEGVGVVAQGADSATIQTEIIEAIQALFPIKAHKIKVMKME